LVVINSNVMKTSRREFIQQSLKAAAFTTVGSTIAAKAAQGAVSRTRYAGNTAFQFEQIKLPYSFNSLEPSIDAQTMEIHYSKHHATYVKNVNEAITAEKVAYNTELEYFTNVSKLSPKIRNNAGGVWNHNFFWMIMRPASGGEVSGKVNDAINAGFGSFDKFKEQFTQAALGRFGSGWAWLVNDNGKLKIGSTPNQDNPLMDASDLKGTPVLALDVWEHAYYLKYQNKRNEYISNWWSVVNWDQVAKLLG
jgi:superoxide dismutase, Fe-Mn family